MDRVPAGCHLFNASVGRGLLLALLLWTIGNPAVAASRFPARGTKGMVVTVHPEASEAGLMVLKKGGNAIDAAVAVGFSLAVVHPQAGNIGGGGFMVIHDAVSGQETTIDFREKAPAMAHRDMYLDEHGEVIEGRSTVGFQAAGVPGTVAGLHLAWKKYGKLPWADLLEPAIRLAEKGFVVNHPFSRSLRSAEKLLSAFPESRRIFLRDGDFYEEGEVFRQPDLAETLKRIARKGPADFYEGETAAMIAKQMEESGGLVTLRDLESYEAKERPPVRGTYRGYEIVSMGPPSSGGIVLIEMLNMIERFDVANLGFHSSSGLHLQAEVMKRAFADRAEFLGDPDFAEIPSVGLLSKEYAEERSEDVRSGWSTPSSMIRKGVPAAYEPSETTHYSVVDSDTTAVAVTTTINRSYGCGVTVKGAGFLLNNEMDDFSSKPGVPNSFGLIQGEANAIGPGKRPLSAMTPTIVKKDGRPFLVLGSPGGPTIINTVFQVILNVIDFRMGIQQAVDAPRIHHQWKPDRIVAERDALVLDVEYGLRSRGHEIDYRDSIGDAHSILIEPETGIRLGAPDPRVGESKASGH